MRVTGCLFCKIANGEQPAAVVSDSAVALAFLDARPVFLGHTLVVPKSHCDTLTDLSAQDLPAFFAEVQRLTRAVEKGCEADGSFVAINNRVSQSVPHMHVHIVPRRNKDGLRGFFWPRQKYASDSEREAFRAAIATALLG